MSALQVVELFAGMRPDGERVVERVQVEVLDDDSCRLVRSPCFIKGVAKGDVIKLDKESQQFELIRRSGNLCIRIFSKEDIETLSNDLTPLLEKLDGELDFSNARMLVYSIHVSAGFEKIEKLLNELMDEEVNAWFYGNVYDPEDGVTPLNWWQDVLKPQ